MANLSFKSTAYLFKLLAVEELAYKWKEVIVAWVTKVEAPDDHVKHGHVFPRDQSKHSQFHVLTNQLLMGQLGAILLKILVKLFGNKECQCCSFWHMSVTRAL